MNVLLGAKDHWIAGRLSDCARFRTRPIALVIRLAFLAAPLSSAMALEDECGGLKVSGYIALRTAGPLKLRVAVTSDKERTEDIGGPGAVHIVELATMAMVVLNPGAKSAVVVSPPPKHAPPPLAKGVEKFLDREPGKDGAVRVSMGLKTSKGKEWLLQTNCRSDGIWTERKTKTPRGITTITQSDIKVEAIPASQFEVPSDYKLVTVPPPK
jgi:hypothetical protein